MVPSVQAGTNLGIKPVATPSNSTLAVDNLAIPFTATGLNFEKDDYNQISVPRTAAYSIGLWFNPKGVGGVFSRNHIFAIAPDARECYTWTHYMISCDASGNFFFNTKDNDGGVQEDEAFDHSTDYNMGSQLALGNYAIGEWHYMVLAVDNANGKLSIYVDGKLDTEANLTSPLIFNQSYLIQFGYFGSSQSVYDEIQFFNRALNADEVTAAYSNAANVEGVASIYTLNEVAEGTTGTYKNQLIGGTNVDAVYYKKKYGYYWGIPYNYGGFKSKSEVAPVTADGRDMSGQTVKVTCGSVQNGTLTFTPADAEVAINEGENTVDVASTYTVTATPADGYALVALKAKTANGEATLVNGSQLCFLGDTEISATFSNNFKDVNVVAEHKIPFVVYHNGLQVATSEDATIKTLVGETYKMVFDVPFSMILTGINVNGVDIAAVDNACEFTVKATTGDVKVNATLKDTYAVTIKQPMVGGVAAGTITVTGWDGEIENGGKAVVGDKLTVAYTPAEGYRFRHYVINDELTAANSIVVEDAVSFGVDAEAGNEYPAMTRTFTNKVGQQNRYMKSMKQVGADDYLFNAETEDELGAEFFPGPTNEFLPNGAVINKTGIRAGHFQIDQATKEFSFVFTPWTDPITTPEGAFNTEFGWTKYAVYMDWNNDGDFTDDGELAAIDEVNCSSNKYLDEANCTKTISVPEGIAAGTYRMRVVFYEPGAANWYETLFETCKINNGVAYDFDVEVASDRFEEARTVTIASNHAGSGSVKFGELPEDAKIEGLSVTTDYKYVTVIAEPAGDAKFVNWTNGETMLTTAETYVYGGTENATLTANFGYEVTAEVEGDGRLSIACDNNNYPSGSVLVYGSEVTITPIADKGFELTELTLNGEKVEVAADGTYTFKLEGVANFKAVYGVHTYTITSKTTGQGSVTMGYDYDADNGTVLDVVANGTEVTDDNMFFCVATPEKGQEVNWIKYVTSEGEYLIYHIDGSGNEEVAPEYSDDANAWYTPSKKSIGFVVMGALDDYEVVVDFSGVGTGINGVELDAANGVIEYYNLQGVKVAAENLAPGFYIARQGNKAVKVLINK